MKRIIYGFLLFFTLSLPAHADFNTGVVAYLMGEYDKAFSTMQSLSQTADHGYAQYYLGMMYLKGQGTEQDYDKASKWLRSSAEKGIPQAQYNLAQLYMQGKGVPRDHELAYVWFKTGAAHKHEASASGVDEAKQNLNEEQLTEANNLSNEYIDKYGPKEGETDKPKKIPNK